MFDLKFFPQFICLICLCNFQICIVMRACVLIFEIGFVYSFAQVVERVAVDCIISKAPLLLVQKLKLTGFIIILAKIVKFKVTLLSVQIRNSV